MNACGRLAGTVLSGAFYQLGLAHSPERGLSCCLRASAGFPVLTALVSRALPTGIARPLPG